MGRQAPVQLVNAEAWKKSATGKADATRKSWEEKEAELADFLEQVEEQRRTLAALDEVVVTATDKIASLADQLSAELKAGSSGASPPLRALVTRTLRLGSRSSRSQERWSPLPLSMRSGMRCKQHGARL